MGLKAAPAHVCSATKPCNLAQARLGGKWGGKTPISRVDTEQHLYILMRYYQATKPEFLLKLHTDPATAALNTVTAYGEGYIEVNQVRFSSSVAFGPEGEVTEWPVESPADITSPLLHQAAGLTEPVRDPMAFLDEPEAAPSRPATETKAPTFDANGNRR